MVVSCVSAGVLMAPKATSKVREASHPSGIVFGSTTADFERNIREWHYEARISELNTALKNGLVNSTVRAAREWYSTLKPLSDRAASLQERIPEDIPEKQKAALTSALYKIKAVLFHLRHTVANRGDSEPYYFHSAAREELDHIEYLPAIQKLKDVKDVGTGKFSTVYPTTLGPLNRALKIALKSNWLSQDHLIEEAKIYTSLPFHPGLLKAGLLVELKDGNIGLLLERGVQDCFTSIQKLTQDSEKELKTMLRDVVGALQFIHEQGYCHNDLKLENIVLCSDGRYAVIDLSMTSRTGTRVHQGTLAYLPAEVYQYATCAPSRDVWSLAITLYHSIFRTPFYTPELARKVRDGISLTDQEIAARLSPYAPTDKSRAFVKDFREQLFKSYVLIDYILYYKDFFKEMLDYIDMHSEEEINKVTTTLESLIEKMNSTERTFLYAQILQGTIDCTVAPNGIIYSILEKCKARRDMAGISLQLLINFLSIPQDLRKQMVGTILEADQSTLSSKRVLATLIDPNNIVLHLIQYCLRGTPGKRATIPQISKHPALIEDDVAKTNEMLEKWISESALLSLETRTLS